MKYAISTPHAPAPFGYYSQGTTAGRFVFTSGQVGISPLTGAMVEGGVEEQLNQAITNVEGILAEVGCTLEDVAKATLYVRDISQFDLINRVYARRFPAPEPARTIVQVEGLPKDALVEIECIACR